MTVFIMSNIRHLCLLIDILKPFISNIRNKNMYIIRHLGIYFLVSNTRHNQSHCAIILSFNPNPITLLKGSSQAFLPLFHLPPAALTILRKWISS